MQSDCIIAGEEIGVNARMRRMNEEKPMLTPG
jgi:hypothetical protein